MSEANLGKLQAAYNLSPVYTQRALIVGGLALVFFAAMLFAFSLRRNIGYLLLAIAFLFVEIVTLFSWVVQRKAMLRVYEKGFVYKNQICHWNEIRSSSLTKKQDFSGRSKVELTIEKSSGRTIVLSDAIENIEQFARRVKHETAA